MLPVQKWSILLCSFIYLCNLRGLYNIKLWNLHHRWTYLAKVKSWVYLLDTLKAFNSILLWVPVSNVLLSQQRAFTFSPFLTPVSSFFFCFSSFPIAPVFSSSCHSSCLCLVSIAGRSCSVQVAVCVDASLHLTCSHSCSRSLNVRPSALCLFRPLFQTMWGVGVCVRVSQGILDTLLIITRMAERGTRQWLF